MEHEEFEERDVNMRRLLKVNLVIALGVFVTVGFLFWLYWKGFWPGKVERPPITPPRNFIEEWLPRKHQEERIVPVVPFSKSTPPQ